MKVKDRERLTEMLGARLPHLDVVLSKADICVRDRTEHALGTRTHTTFVSTYTIRADYKGPGWRDRLVEDVAKAIEGDR